VADTAVPIRRSAETPPPAGPDGCADGVRVLGPRDLGSSRALDILDTLDDFSSGDGKALRRAFGAFPTGVAALAALVDGEPVGMAVNSFTSVSLDPPLASVCAASGSRTWRRLRTAAHLGISVLSASQEQACVRLAARDVDRFAGLPWRASGDGAVLLGGASAWFECSVEREIRAGDHEIVVLRVHRFGVEPQPAPLVFHGSRYRRLAE
jgi:flavin reductase (DIM6/NTAB) family NADH-FMN oxidoreductase RutF